MKALFDTSVLVPALVTAHEFHRRAAPWLNRGKTGDMEVCISQHSLAETFNTLTTLPLSPRISPLHAKHVIDENILPFAKVVSLSPTDYGAILERMVRLSLPGPLVYDAIIAHAAQKAGVDQLLTLDPDDFLRVWPEGADKIREP